MGSSVVAFGDSHPGLVHPRNEDSLAIAPQPDGAYLLVVCDGMGGMGRGDQASRLAVRHLLMAFGAAEGDLKERLLKSVTSTDLAIRAALCVGGRGHAGCTVAIAHVFEGTAQVAWVGDSRVYLVRSGAVITRTRDHKLVQELVDLGQLTPEEAKRSSLSSVITRALGGRPPGPLATQPAFLEPWKTEPGDTIVLCSDGLADLVPDEELPSLLAPKPEGSVAKMIQVACDRGGHDNISVIVANFGPEGAPDDVAPREAGAVTVLPEPTPAPVTRTVSSADAARARRATEARLSPPWLVVPAAVGVVAWAIIHSLNS